jgi:hypothetical protein
MQMRVYLNAFLPHHLVSQNRINTNTDPVPFPLLSDVELTESMGWVAK